MKSSMTSVGSSGLECLLSMPEAQVLGCVPKIFKLENAKENAQRAGQPELLGHVHFWKISIFGRPVHTVYAAIFLDKPSINNKI